MTKRTSVETYRKVTESGLLSRLRTLVYKVIYEHGPITQGECWKLFFEGRGVLAQNSVTPRFAELEARGVIANVGSRPCKTTGHESFVYVTTDDLPVEPKKSKKIKCPHCKGKGYTMEVREKPDPRQMELFPR